MIVDSESYVLNTLIGEAFVLVNKKLLKYFKGDGTLVVFLSELISMHKYFLNNQSLEVDNSFPIPVDRLKYSLGMSAYKQDSSLERLIKSKIIYTFTKGFPAKRYVIINFDSIVHILNAEEAKVKKDTKLFYETLNATLNSCTYSKGSIQPVVEEACDNISPLLKGVIVLILQDFRRLNYSTQRIEWTPELIGKVRSWVNKRSIGKPFDFTIVTRALKQTPIDVKGFSSFISLFIHTAKGVQDVHPDDQVHDYLQLL
jgi:hypothetical protein